MKKLVLIVAILFTVGCGSTQEKSIVVTSTMHTDMVKNLVNDLVIVEGLVPAGADPHLYTPSANDVTKMQNASVIVYAGIDLEGKMGDLLSKLTDDKRLIINAGEGISEDKLIKWEDDASIYDPHIWFDVDLFKDETMYVSKQLQQAFPEIAEKIKENEQNYLNQLSEAQHYVDEKAQQINKQQRVLITAHDAFSYFGRAHDFEVYGIQGISTEDEASTADMSTLANFIVDRKIKAIFVESSVPPKTIEALQAAVKAQGFNVEIGGELYSDSLAENGSYIDMIKTNIDVLSTALKGQ